jgi:hypothetical protein
VLDELPPNTISIGDFGSRPFARECAKLNISRTVVAVPRALGTVGSPPPERSQIKGELAVMPDQSSRVQISAQNPYALCDASIGNGNGDGDGNGNGDGDGDGNGDGDGDGNGGVEYRVGGVL